MTLSACASPDPIPDRLATADYSDPIVLFVSPDSQEVSRLHQRLGDDFYVTADDAMWYRAAAYDMLDEMNLAYAEAPRSSARFLVDGEPTLVSWENVDRAWFALVYDGAAAPRVVADIDLPEAVRGQSGASVP